MNSSLFILDIDRDPPFFFQKPCDSTVDTHGTTPSIVPYPPMTANLHYEAELVVAIGKGGLRIKSEEALECIYGYAIGCDLTRRDLQADAKKMGRPWATAKGFDSSAPIGPIIPKDEITLHSTDRIALEVNGVIRQDSTLGHMTWNVPDIISHLSKYFCLKPGDLIMTGTPGGVDKLDIGDDVIVSCGKLPKCEFHIGPEES
jgi:fumarylpyruvate hydrolase